MAAELKVADALTDGPLAADELARRVGADPDALARLMRAVISEGIFVRHSDGRFALNALGETLRSNAPRSMAGMARFVGHPAYREHWSGLLDAARTGEAVPPTLRGISGWDFMAQTPDLVAVFNDAMTSVSEFAVDPVVTAYDFAPYRTIIDVGGGHGRLLAAIIAATPGARGVLYDLPQVVEGAPELLKRYGVADRIGVESGSFFDGVPEGGDAYLLKNVIHDWPDAESVTILSNIRGAAMLGATLLLVEFVIPDHDREFIGKWADMEMLVQVGARERTAEDYRKLYEQAGFQLTRVVPTAGPISIVEGQGDLAGGRRRGARVLVGRRSLEATPEQVDHQFGGLVDVGVAGTDAVGHGLARTYQRDRHHVEIRVGLGVPGARLQQSGDQVDDPLTTLAHRVRERLRARRLCVQHDPRGTVGVDVVQEREHRVAQQILRALSEVDLGTHRFDEPAQLAVKARAEEFLLGAVVKVEHRLGDLGLCGDRVHRGLVIAVDGEHLNRGVEHLLLTHGTRQPLGSTRHDVPFRDSLLTSG